MKIEKIDGVLLRKAIKGAVKFLEINKEEINALNVFPVPDGDTGTNMLLTVKSAMNECLRVEEDDVSKISQAFSKGSLMGARGNSGVILSQIFRGFTLGLDNNKSIDVETLAEALKEASNTAYKAVMKPTEGTILTIIRECGTFAMEIKSEETDISKFLARVIEHGYVTLDKTPDMLPVLKQAGVVDAGGKGLLRLFEGAKMAIDGELDLISETYTEQIIASKEIKKEVHSHDIEFGYCTEFMINTEFDDIEKLREDLSLKGDSLLVVGGDGIIKVHIHTNNPGNVLEEGLKLGYLTDIKIDNMRLQHEEVLLKDELEKARRQQAEAKKYSIIAVSSGKGFDEVFKDLNVDVTVSGGQTMNPSTEDFLKAIEKTNGENVIILPNNSNIILAAEQTKHLSDRKIYVLPTTNIPQGISALISFDESLTAEENIDNMTSIIEDVIAGEVTYAVRDTEMNGRIIKKDDIIGISGKEIISSGNNLEEVSLKLIDSLINEDISIISCFYGEDTSEEEANRLVGELEEKYEDIDIELIYGGQPLYYYLFSIE